MCSRRWDRRSSRYSRPNAQTAEQRPAHAAARDRQTFGILPDRACSVDRSRVGRHKQSMDSRRWKKCCSQSRCCRLHPWRCSPSSDKADRSHRWGPRCFAGKSPVCRRGFALRTSVVLFAWWLRWQRPYGSRRVLRGRRSCDKPNGPLNDRQSDPAETNRPFAGCNPRCN